LFKIIIQVLRCLTVLHSNKAADDELTYPYLRELLKFDTREVLNVISLAFQEKEFNGELGLSHRQRIINILMEILTPEHGTVSNSNLYLTRIRLLRVLDSLETWLADY
jgi:vacuolar protein sorting-associated protein 8